MKRDISLWSFSGFSLVSLGGTILHFLYDWTNESILIAPFSGVNESTWEHMKLLFFPLFVFALVQSFFFKEYKNFWWIKLFSTLLGLTLIPVMFYTYNGCFGRSPDWLNITFFFIAAAVSFTLENALFKKNSALFPRPKLAFLTLVILGGLFVIFTFLPPHIPLFLCPVANKYGI